MKPFVCLLLIAPAHAFADDAPAAAPLVVEEAPRDERVFIPLSFSLPQIGIGMVTRGDNEMELGKRSFDGTLRYGPAGNLTRRWRLGGFVEARTASFDTFEVAVGPHTEFAISEMWGVQLRTGLGMVADEDARYALAGIQVGTPLLGVTVTGRRYFEDAHVEVSVNLEISTIVGFALTGAPLFGAWN